jgi:hypothetical protein
MERKTQKQLQALVDRLNQLSDLPKEPYYSGCDHNLHSAYHEYRPGHYVAAGCYLLGSRNRLERMSLTPGCTGQVPVLTGGTANAVWDKIMSYTKGYVEAKDFTKSS